MLDRFTDEIFTAGGAALTHALPDSPQARTIPTLSLRPLIKAVLDFLHELLQDALRDCLVAFGAIGTVVRDSGPVIPLLAILILIVTVEFAIRRYRNTER